MKLTFPITIFLTMCLIFTYGFWLGTKNPETEVYDSNAMTEQTLVQRVPTVTQMQRAVGAEPDGFWGKDSQKKWEERICQQAADDNWPKGE